ncbi:hypothetical protein BU23DRAFT_245639 [Bimuria novae-zelandiae CBS 107.79]|uniref:Uncharacterized protein n=1 Tax=Bimuria novae-zelandiae CBS 107.79 TaxID=1447943 RepID=A0A6A5UWC1_9PLEO|nr:hypothetical protein BU23DRAFT_245639 [Bimuria novae-zelandiae CBS 107.79]
MKLRTAPLLATLTFLPSARAEVAPDITVVEEGYNYIAKLPCLGCPFLFQDTSAALNEPWRTRKDDNALLLNISLPYTCAFLALNTAPLSSGTSIPPLIHAPQVVQDFSSAELLATLATGQLEASHETALLGGGASFGLSYRYSLHSLRTTSNLQALVFHFDVAAVYSDLATPPTHHALTSPAQKMLEIVLLERPVHSATDPSPAYSIVKIALVSRTPSISSRRTIDFLAWDAHGRIGTPSHLLSYLLSAFAAFLTSGFWALFGFVMAVIVVFIVVVLLCVFGWEFWRDDYEKAQKGKHTRKSSAKGRADVESGTGRAKARFKSAEELGLGLASRGQVVGMGKSD